MPERVKQIWGRVRDFFKNMKKGLKIGLIAGVVAVVALAAALVLYNKSKPYVILFGGLSSEDLTAVVSYLDTAGAKDFKIRNNDTVLVRESQADRLRAAVIQQGYPKTGYSHDTYLNNIGPLSSQADREQLRLLDLQDYLAATIRWFDGVTDVRVTITPGEDHRYILDEQVTEATAGVFVQMANGKSLTSDQVTAIQQWVASAEQGLTISNVVVTDNRGNRYTSDGNDGGLNDTLKYKLALEEKVNEQTRNSVMQVLVPYCGLNNVEVSVHSTVDVTHSYSELLQYYEPDWAADGSSGGKGIIGSQIWDNSWIRDGDVEQGGVVGTATNSEINEYVTRDGTPRGDEREVTSSGEINYNVSHETTQTERPAGTITDLTVAIAINSSKISLQNPNELKFMAAMAAGIDASQMDSKIAIVSYQFYTESTGGSPIEEVSMILGLPAWAVYAAIAGIALFLALLLVLLLLRNKKKQKLALLLAEEQAAADAAAAAAAAAAAQGADIMDVHTEESMKMRMDVRQFVEENPAIAAQMIKNWLRGEESDKMQT